MYTYTVYDRVLDANIGTYTDYQEADLLVYYYEKVDREDGEYIPGRYEILRVNEEEANA